MALGLGILLAPGWVLSSSADGLVPQIVTDPLTGVALDGFDPVSYFTNAEPIQGKPDYEYDWSGVPWYFANAANRDVFIQSPDIYAPQFGGHGAMSMAQGYLSDGNPQIYVVAAKRLYLFYSPENRNAFMAAPAASIDNARRNWRQLSRQFPAEPAVTTAAPPAAKAQ